MKRSPAKRTPLLTLTVQQASTLPIPVRATLRRWLLAALCGGTRKSAITATITLRFVDSREGKKLNRVYRGKDYATNVLTFPYTREGECFEGDIVLCMPVVCSEARAQGKSWRAHCAHLAVHGMLHLLGFDHENEKDAQKMEARETAILADLGYPDPYPVS